MDDPSLSSCYIIVLEDQIEPFRFFNGNFRCAFIYGADGKLEKFTQSMQERLLRDVIEPMACDGLRTISLAFRDFVPGKAEINQVHYDSEPNWDDEDSIINNLTCLCIVGIEDPVRPEVKKKLLTS